MKIFYIYRSKIFGVLAILFLVGLVWMNSSKNEKHDIPQPSPGTVISKNSIMVDPKKPLSEQSIYERVILYLFADKIKEQEAIANRGKPSSQVTTVLSVGDTAKIRILDLNKAGAVGEDKVIEIGKNQLEPEIEQAILGMRVGELRLVKYKDTELQIGVIEISRQVEEKQK